MHPLVHDLDKLKDSELDSKISDLTRKYFMIANPDARQQIAMILDSHKEELSKRRAAAYEKMMSTRDKGLDKLININ